MKKFLSLFLATAMLVSVFTGCGAKPEGDISKEVGEGKVLMIGGSGPLTGDYATYGVSVKQGAELAVKEINEKGGVNGVTLQVKIEDDQADPALAVNAYASLFDAGMKVSLGGVTSGACIAASEEANKDGMLMLTPSGSQKDCTKYPGGFRVCFTDPDQGLYAANFMAENKMAKSVAILYDKSNDYSSGIVANFEKQAKEVGLNIVEKQAFTDQSNTDFSVQLQAVKSSGAELLFMPIYAQEAAYVLTQAEKVGLKVIFFGCDGLDGIIEKIGKDNVKATEGVVLLTPFAADSQEPVSKAFTDAYKASYNSTPDQFAADGYDAIYAITEAFKSTGMSDVTTKDFNEQMIAAMTKITVKGATGTMTWSADGEPAKSATAVKIVNGAYVAYK